MLLAPQIHECLLFPVPEVPSGLIKTLSTFPSLVSLPRWANAEGMSEAKLAMPILPPLGGDTVVTSGWREAGDAVPLRLQLLLLKGPVPLGPPSSLWGHVTGSGIAVG